MISYGRPSKTGRIVRRLLLPLVVFIAAAFTDAAAGQGAAPTAGQETAATRPPEGLDEVIVRGRRVGELRLEIQRAEQAVFARFNDINSTDDFDIHCRNDKSYGLMHRSCLSNIWRKLQGQIAREQVLAMRGQGSGSAAQLIQAEQIEKQRQLADELRGLAEKDEQLEAAVAELAQAQTALLLRVGNVTLSRQVTAALGTLPYDAKLMFEVIMGNNPWRHVLTQRTFTIANVFGDVRKVSVECDEGSRRIDYEIGVDWTVPTDWSACTLEVKAKKGSTFRLYEF
jgi:hypothetical protein